MSRNWSEYNQVLVKRGEILISPSFSLEEEEQGKKKGRPYTYSFGFICFFLFIKFALRLPYGQTEGLTRQVFGALGLKIPNFGTLHYRFTKSDISLSDFPEPEELPDDFVIILDSSIINKKLNESKSKISISLVKE